MNIPRDWQAKFGPDIDWPNVMNLGNLLRHVYHGLNVTTLWTIYQNDFGPLEAAIDRMLAAHVSN